MRLVYSIIGILLLGSFAQAAPNVVIILADDLGFSDLGCYGGEIKTPNLDGLAAKGLRYTQFYNTGRCWPTRGALLTGYYPQQIGRDSAPGIPKSGKRPDWAWLLPRYLKAAGYRSYHSGKWHIDGMPVANGFDRSYYLKDQHRFFSPTLHYQDDKKLPAVKRGSGYYGTIAVADKTIAYLKQHQAKHADKPFFAYVAFAAPHFPLHALPEDIARVGDRYAPGWDVIRKQRWERIKKLGIAGGTLSAVERQIGPPYHFPDSLKILGEGEVNRPLPWKQLSAKQKRFQQDKMTIHAAMIERMDHEIGRILAQIKSMGVFDDTLIMFLSDNGASAEIMVRADGHDPKAIPGSADSHLCLGPGWSNVGNTPYRRHKTWVHEGGACTPFIAHWPKGIAPGPGGSGDSGGKLRHDPGHVIDLTPTLLELAGINIGSKLGNQAPAPFAGRSLLESFAKPANWRRSLWWYHEGNRAMRVGDWKIVSGKNEAWELFDLKQDRTESNNLADAKPKKVAELEAQWQAMIDQFRKVAPAKAARPKGKSKNRNKK